MFVHRPFFLVRSFLSSSATKASVELDKASPTCAVLGSFISHAPDSYFAKLAISTNSRYNRGFADRLVEQPLSKQLYEKSL